MRHWRSSRGDAASVASRRKAVWSKSAATRAAALGPATSSLRNATRRSSCCGVKVEMSGSPAVSTGELGAPFKKAASCRNWLRRKRPTSCTSMTSSPCSSADDTAVDTALPGRQSLLTLRAAPDRSNSEAELAEVTRSAGMVRWTWSPLAA